MILGKRFSRYQRRWNAKIAVTFTREDGTVIKPHRKLNMMLALSLSIKGGIRMKAFKKEEAKLLAKVAVEEAKNIRPGQVKPIDLTDVESMVESTIADERSTTPRLKTEGLER